MATKGREDNDSDTEDEDLSNDKPPTEEYSCPRWTEITQYLFRNRGPLELALDTMAIVSEPAFYRYIRDRGGITLTSRNFLGVASAKEELFMCDSTPIF